MQRRVGRIEYRGVSLASLYIFNCVLSKHDPSDPEGETSFAISDFGQLPLINKYEVATTLKAVKKGNDESDAGITGYLLCVGLDSVVTKLPHLFSQSLGIVKDLKKAEFKFT